MMLHRLHAQPLAQRRVLAPFVIRKVGACRPLKFKETDDDKETSPLRDDGAKPKKSEFTDDLKKPQNLQEVVKPKTALTTYDPRAFRAPGPPGLLPTFSRRREVFAGRAAMVGFAATCLWEIFTPQHLGPLAQVQLLTGWSPASVDLLFLGFIAHGLAGALWTEAPTYNPLNQQDVLRRPVGPPGVWVNPLTEPAKFFGCSPRFGFTKKNELLNGRLAMLGFAAACFMERATGLGALGQVAWWANAAPPGEGWYLQAGSALLAWAGLMFVLARLGSGSLIQGRYEDMDIY